MTSLKRYMSSILTYPNVVAEEVSHDALDNVEANVGSIFIIDELLIT